MAFVPNYIVFISQFAKHEPHHQQTHLHAFRPVSKPANQKYFLFYKVTNFYQPTNSSKAATIFGSNPSLTKSPPETAKLPPSAKEPPATLPRPSRS